MVISLFFDISITYSFDIPILCSLYRRLELSTVVPRLTMTALMF